MADESARFALPLLAAGQAQKEVLHNEALTIVDLMLHAVAETAGDDAPPGAPTVGRCWIVGATPGGAWAGQASMLACFTEGGWRFVAPVEGMAVWVKASGVAMRRGPGGWGDGAVAASEYRIGGQRVVGPRQPAIAAPSGGATIDAQARATLAAVLSMLQSHGLIAA